MPKVKAVLDPHQSAVTDHHLLDVAGSVSREAVDGQLKVLYQGQHQALAGIGFHSR